MKLSEKEILNIKNSLAQQFPLLDMGDYEQVFCDILKACSETKIDENFIDYYYNSLKEYFNKVNWENIPFIISEYFKARFNFNVKSTKELIEQIDKLAMFLMKNGIEFSLELFKFITNNYPEFGNLFKKLDGITESDLLSICGNELVYEFVFLLFDFLDLEIKEDNSNFNDNGDIFSHRLLTKEETFGLFERLKNGDTSAREIIASHNYKLVRSIASKFSNLRSFTFDDVFDCGVEGLMQAIDRFDNKLGVKFGTYATPYIKGHIYKNLIKYDAIVRIETARLEKTQRILNIKNMLEQRMHREADIYDIASESGMLVEEVLDILSENANLNVTSFDAIIGGESDSDLTLKDALGSDWDLESEVIKGERSNLTEILASLNEREREIFLLSKGIGGRKYTRKELSKKFNVSGTRIGQINKKVRAILSVKLSSFEHLAEERTVSSDIHKIKFNDYFLGMSTNKLRNFISHMPDDYIKEIYRYYTDKLRSIPSNEMMYKSDFLLGEIVPFMFNRLFEIDDAGRIIPFFKNFPGVSVSMLIRHARANRMPNILKRYGNNLDELNYLTDEENKLLYASEIPRLYNYYLSIKSKTRALEMPLTVRYKNLDLRELIECIGNLDEKDQTIAFQMYGSRLDEFHSEHYNKIVCKRIFKLVGDYITFKFEGKNLDNDSSVVILQEAKSLREIYNYLDVNYLKTTVASLDKRDYIYLRHGVGLNELNPLDAFSSKMYLGALKELEKKIAKDKKLRSTAIKIGDLPLTDRFNMEYRYLSMYIKLLDREEQKLLEEIYGSQYDEFNGCLEMKRYALELVIKHLKKIIDEDIKACSSIKNAVGVDMPFEHLVIYRLINGSNGINFEPEYIANNFNMTLEEVLRIYDEVCNSITVSSGLVFSEEMLAQASSRIDELAAASGGEPELHLARAQKALSADQN